MTIPTVHHLIPIDVYCATLMLSCSEILECHMNMSLSIAIIITVYFQKQL